MLDSLLEQRRLGDLAAVAVALGHAGDAGLDEEAGAVGIQLLGEKLVVGDQMGARPDGTHLADQDIPELRELIQAAAPEEAAEGIDAGIAFAGLLVLARMAWSTYIHRAELENSEAMVAVARSLLDVEDGTGRLQALHQPHQNDQGRKHQDYDW